MSLLPPETVGKLQQALHGKAKESPSYRLYSLYDKIYRLDVLWHAYRVFRFNDGAPGVDGVTSEEIESQGQMRWLGGLAEELRMQRYCPAPVRRVHIPKAEKPQTNPSARDSDD